MPKFGEVLSQDNSPNDRLPFLSLKGPEYTIKKENAISRWAIIHVCLIFGLLTFIVLIIAFVMMEGHYRRQHEQYNFDEDIFMRVRHKTLKVGNL